MRFFELLNFQHTAAMILVTFIFLILFAVALGFIPTTGPLKNRMEIKGIQEFADGIRKGEGPFPLIITLVIAGTVLWAVFYILYYGFSEVIL